MKILLGALVLFASVCHAQMPNSPSAVKAFALNVGLDSRYSFTNSVTEVSPRVGVDYRLSTLFRVGVSYSHPLQVLAPPSVAIKNGPAQTNSLTLSLNYKLMQWGKAR